MRWLILSLIVAAMTPVAPAEARRLVISEPILVRRCPRFNSWGKVMSCLNQHYKAKLTRELPGAKLVTLYQKVDKPVDTGVVLYVERGGTWQIGGRFEGYAEYALLGLSRVTVGRRSGYRLDIGQVSPISVMVDGVSTVTGEQRMHRTLFCSGDSYACPEAVSSCDVSVGGQAWFVFRGALRFEENIVNVDGDRERAGPYCAVSSKVYLGWVQR